MVGIGEKLVRRERPPAVAPLWWEHLACLSQQKNPGAKISSPDPRLYFTQDANWDTMAVVGYDGTSGTWGVVQRYVYSPYGTITVLNADWSTPPAGPGGGGKKPPGNGNVSTSAGDENPFKDGGPFKTFEDAAGLPPGSLDNVGNIGARKDPTMSNNGYTQKWIGQDWATGDWYSPFRNPETGGWAGGDTSSHGR